MAKETSIIPFDFTEEQKNLIQEKTPSIMRKKVRKGGGTYDYVPVGYIIDRLNRIFDFKWTFEVLREQVGDHQVWVLGRLQVMQDNGVVIRKENYGGADIKRYSNNHKNAGQPLSIGNELKAAAADSLKKSASMLGVCLDVYAPVLDEVHDMEDAGDKMTKKELAQVKEWEASLRGAKSKEKMIAVGKDIGLLKINAAQREYLEEVFMECLSKFEDAKK